MNVIDEKNFAWFKNDHTKASLVAIKLAYGELRGLNGTPQDPFQVNFEYPITAIAGRNGSGKTTVLALAACAYHNNDLGFTPFRRSKPYYTIGDFFVQSGEEESPEGVAIFYLIRYNHWKKSKDFPSGTGDGSQQLKKKRGGRWSPDYKKRIYRNVVYLGVERVLPHAEDRTARGKSKYFVPGDPVGWEEDVCQIVSRVLGRPYQNFHYRYTAKERYRLPVVSYNGRTYTGFNMGAGESAVFDIFSTIYDCTQKTRKNRGVLILVDEIELGLHEEAQIRLMQELKKICAEKQVQVICTTHSAAIFDCLPPEGRIFLERQGNHTEVMVGVTAAFATGKLSGNPQAELDIFVEDEVAQTLVESLLPNVLRARVNVLPIGSANALLRQLAARYRERQAGHGRDACIIFDGDERSQKAGRIKLFLNKLEHFKSDAEEQAAEEWIAARLSYLPGDTWPENWVVTQDPAAFTPLTAEFGVTQHELTAYLETARLAGKHNEFYTLAQHLNHDQSYVCGRFCRLAMLIHPSEIERLCHYVQSFLV